MQIFRTDSKMISTTQGQQVIQTANGQQIIVQNMSQPPNQVQIQSGSEIPQIQVRKSIKQQRQKTSDNMSTIPLGAASE